MEAIPYKLRLQLSDEIPQEGQRRVMARIPAFDAPEIDNSFFPLTGGGKTLRGMVLNMALGRFPAETAAQRLPEPLRRNRQGHRDELRLRSGVHWFGGAAGSQGLE
mgnify:CR=1 FL=1